MTWSSGEGARTRAVDGFVRRAPWRASIATLSAGLLLAQVSPARAICRVVEPDDAPPVAFDSTTSAFFVITDDVVLDHACGEDDAGAVEDDAGAAMELDAGTPPVELDAGALPDSSVDDGGPRDAGPRICADGTVAREVVGSLVSLVIQPRLTGGGGHAGLVMPVAARPDVALGPADAFAALEATAASLDRRVHETVIVTEDASLGFQCTDPHYTSELEPSATDSAIAMTLTAPMALYGCAAEASPYYRAGTDRRDVHEVDYGDGDTVRYESIPVSDAYSVTVLSASTLDALTAWMDGAGFAHDAFDDAAFEAYVGPGRWFVALDVHPPAELERTELGIAGLAPLVVSWPGDEIPIQNRLQYDPDGGTLVTETYVLAPTRVDAEDGSALLVASGDARLPESLASFGRERGVLTRLRIARQQRDELADSRLVPTSGVVELPGTIVERTTRVRVPLACCVGGGVASRSAPPRTFTYEREWDEAMGMPAIPEAWFHTPEHAASEPFCAAGSGSGGRGGRGFFCTVASFPVSGFGPIVLALAWIALRARRRR